MLLFLLLFLSFAQVGLLGLGGNAGSQALLEHEIITLHHWLTPAQLSDLMVFCRTLPGGTGLNAATLTGYLAASARFGFWGTLGASLISVVGLALPAAAWTALITKLKDHKRYQSLLDSLLVLLRPMIPGLIIAAAVLMMRADNFGSPTENPWNFWVSIFLFVATLIGTGVYRFNALFMILVCGVAGCILL